MLQSTKSLLCVVLLFQILFSTVPFINSAVIRQNALSSDETLFDRDVNPATSLGLEDDEHLLLINDVNDETTTLENLVQDAITTTTTVVADTKKDDTIPIDENTVGSSSSDVDQHIALKTVNENESKSELTSTEPEIKSTTAQINETSTVMENESTTSKEQVQMSTLFEEDSVNKSEKEDKPETTAKSVDEDTTQMLSTLFVEETTTNEEHENTTLKELSLQTSTDASTVNSTEIDSTTKTTQPVTNFKLEDSDKATVSLLSHTELIDTSTELTDENDSKIMLINSDNEMTTESDLKLPEVTTELPMSTFTSTEHDNKTMYPDLKGTPSNETKTSNSSSTEKRGKYIDHNYSSLNEFRLPNTSDVWALASLRSVGKSKNSELQNSVETSEEKPANSSLITKNLHDWTRVMDTTHDMESKSALRSEEQSEKLTTDRIAPVATTINNVEELQSTVKEIDSVTEITTETPIHEDVTESRMIIENEVELPTAKIEIESTTVTVLTPSILTDKTDKETTEFQMTNNDFETTTITTENNDNIDRTTFNYDSPKDSDDTTTTVNSAKNLNIHEKTIEESDNKIDSDADFEKETTKLPTTTTKVTFIPQFIVPEKSEANDSHVNAEITHQEENTNAGTISLLTPSSSSDFTTSTPILTSPLDATTKTTVIVMTDVTSTTPPGAVSSEYGVNEAPNTDSTEIPSQTTSPGRMTIESSSETTTNTPAPTTTSTTTMPAVIIKSATSEIQTATTTTTTTEAPHTNTITPSIISNETMMIQKTESNNNYNEYEVVSKSTENYPDSSSTEAFEATTRRVASNLTANATTVRVVVDEEISTTEVDKLDEDLETTTIVSDFENNNADDIESTVQSDIKTVTFAPKTQPIETATLTLTPIDVIKTSTDSNLDHIDSKHINSDTSETSIESNVIDPVQVDETSTAATTTTTTTKTTTESMKINLTEGGGSDGVYSIFSTTTTTTTTTPTPPTTTSSTPKSIYDESPTTFESISTKKEDVYSIVPTIDHGGVGGFNVPKLVLDDTTTVSTTTLMTPGDLGMGSGIMRGGIGAGSVLQPIDSPEGQETDVNVIIAISVSAVGIVALILLVAFLYVMRKRQKQMSYGQRCRPVSLDAYSLDNVSVYNSVRRKGATLRASKRSYGNVAFDDPSLRHNVLGTHDLARYVDKKSSIWEEFKEVPQIIARADEVPAGCEEKNRYANVIPLPETRVILQQLNGDEKSEYINANYVRGPKDTTNYYIACQAPLETTVTDFWRMIWEQNSRVIIMATDLIENGIDKCAEYLPPSVTLDNHTVFGDFQVTLKHREVKEKYAISTLMLKNTSNDESREITHYWYQWPEAGVPTDEAAIIAMLLEARSSLKASTIEQNECKIESTINDDNTTSVKIEINGNINSDKSKMSTKDQGPLTIHCSPGTGRTGTILACDIAMRCLEEPKRTVDIPQIVYSVRRGRASAVQTKEQYEFIYKVTHMYATKISNINNDN